MKDASSIASRPRAFTLLELLVSTAVIGLIVVVLAQVTGQTSKIWRYTAARSEQFRESRKAFDSMTRRIGQATLNTYLDYDSYAAPREFVRRSELRFISGPTQNGLSSTKLDATTTIPRPSHGIFFQAPFGFVANVNAADTISASYMGLDTLLNTWGYFIEVNDDSKFRPTFLTTALVPLRMRYRLMEFMQPSNAMNIYGFTSGQPGQDPDDTSDTAPRNYGSKGSANNGFEWFRNAFTAATGTDPSLYNAHVLAENVIALAILPKLAKEDIAANKSNGVSETSLAPKYYYHSGETGTAATANPLVKGLLNSKHQLPPVLQVTMVAIDEGSALRANLKNPFDDRYGVLKPTFLTDATKYQSDLLFDPNNPATGIDALEKRLIDGRVSYRIFTSDVYLRGAKWSRIQAK